VTYFADLGPCTYFDFRGDDARLIAVGWLDATHPFTKGKPSPQFIAALARLLAQPLQPVLFFGPHFCELCAPPSRAGGYLNLFVPSKHGLFAAPQLITHYIDAHEYAPPETFQQAVLDCPAMGSPEYIEAVRAHGLRLADPPNAD
jgi:hypothetical protein